MRRNMVIDYLFIRPFGSLKIFILLSGILLLSHMADIGATYYTLAQAGGNLEAEGNTIVRELMHRYGFWAAAVFHKVPRFTITITEGIVFFYSLRLIRAPFRATRVFVVAFITTSSISAIMAVMFHIGVWTSFIYHPAVWWLYTKLLIEARPTESFMIWMGILSATFLLFYISGFEKKERPLSVQH